MLLRQLSLAAYRLDVGTFVPDDFGEAQRKPARRASFASGHASAITASLPHSFHRRWAKARSTSTLRQVQHDQGLQPQRPWSAFRIPLPKLSVQREICCLDRTSTTRSRRSIVTGIETQIATLTAYRKSLIHECVTGQRRITEADINRVKAHG